MRGWSRRSGYWLAHTVRISWEAIPTGVHVEHLRRSHWTRGVHWPIPPLRHIASRVHRRRRRRHVELRVAHVLHNSRDAVRKLWLDGRVLEIHVHVVGRHHLRTVPAWLRTHACWLLPRRPDVRVHRRTHLRRLVLMRQRHRSSEVVLHPVPLPEIRLLRQGGHHLRPRTCSYVGLELARAGHRPRSHRETHFRRHRASTLAVLLRLLLLLSYLHARGHPKPAHLRSTGHARHPAHHARLHPAHVRAGLAYCLLRLDASDGLLGNHTCTWKSTHIATHVATHALHALHLVRRETGHVRWATSTAGMETRAVGLGGHEDGAALGVDWLHVHGVVGGGGAGLASDDAEAGVRALIVLEETKVVLARLLTML